MAYVTPPTFTAGSVLSAAQLNTIGDDITFLKGVIDAPVACVNVQTLAADGTIHYAFRFTNDNLVFKYTNDGANSDVTFEIYDDDSSWKTIFVDDPLQAESITDYWSYTEHSVVEKVKFVGEGSAHTGVASTVNMTVGNHYEIRAVYDANGNTLSFNYLYNSTGTAI